jgi:hypothetical protein
MGICGSDLQDNYDLIVMKEIEKARHVLKFLGVKTSSKAAKQLHEPFDRAVINSDGEAEVKKLLHSLTLPYHKFYHENFLCFGNTTQKDRHGNNHEVCSFSQYIVGVWNLCTMTVPQGLAEWTFRMEWGENPVTAEDVFELFDKQYGISEARDFNANVGKAWYGEDYHKHNVQRTMKKIKEWVNADDGLMHVNGFVHFVNKVPGILQGHISSRRVLRESICGETFWKAQDAKRHKDGDLESIDKLVSALELLYPGCLVTHGDGLTGIHGSHNDDAELTDEAKTVLKAQAVAESVENAGSSYLHHGHGHKHHDGPRHRAQAHVAHASQQHHRAKPTRHTLHSNGPIDHAGHHGHATTRGGHADHDHGR